MVLVVAMHRRFTVALDATDVLGGVRLDQRLALVVAVADVASRVIGPRLVARLKSFFL